MALDPTDSFVATTKYGSQNEPASLFVTGGFAGEIGTPADGDYTVVLHSPAAFNITSFVTKTASGTLTASVKKNGSTVITGQAVTSTKATLVTAVSVAIGDLLEITVSASSSPSRFAYMLGILRV